MSPLGHWANSLTGDEGSIILDPAWDGAGGFKNGSVVIGEKGIAQPRRRFLSG